MAAGYTVFASSLFLSSSLLEHPCTVRWAWGTILALSRNGVVEGIHPGALARKAHITPEQAAEALNVFLSPDPFSESQKDEGRRLRLVDADSGTYELVNHDRYRDLVKKTHAAKRQEKFRKKVEDEIDEVTLKIFEELWALVPKKAGKRDALLAFSKLCRDGGFPPEKVQPLFSAAIENYKAGLRPRDYEEGYIKNGDTLFRAIINGDYTERPAAPPTTGPDGLATTSSDLPRSPAERRVWFERVAPRVIELYKRMNLTEAKVAASPEYRAVFATEVRLNYDDWRRLYEEFVEHQTDGRLG